MPGAVIPDIRPFIATEKWAIRCYLCMALLLVGIGLLLIVGGFTLAIQFAKPVPRATIPRTCFVVST